jgi:MATE family, multidrug efflux pump
VKRGDCDAVKRLPSCGAHENLIGWCVLSDQVRRLPMTPQHLDEPRWAGLTEVLRMAGPIIFGSLSYTVMHFVDQAMVARLGTDALGAVGSAGLWAFTLTTFHVGVVSCVSTFAAQSYGREQRADCARYAWQGVYYAIFSSVFVFLFWPLAEPLFAMMPHSEEVTRLETAFFKIRTLSFPLIAWQAALASFFQAVNRPRVPMYIAVFVNILNIVLDYLLIFGKFGFPELGVEGAAWATGVALAVQVVLLQWVFMSRAIDRTFLTRSTAALDLKRMRELLRIGWPAGLSFLLDILNWAIFTGFIVGAFGSVALAAHNAAIQFMHMSFMPAMGLNHAVAAIVGQWIGRDDIPRAKARTYTALRIGCVYMIMMGAVFAVFGGPLIRIFFSTNPEVIRLGRALLIMAALFQGFDAVNIICAGALRAAGDTRFLAILTAVSGYGIFLPLATILAWPMGYGALGAWMGATIFIIALSGVLLTRFHRERWRHIRIFDADRMATPD